MPRRPWAPPPGPRCPRRRAGRPRSPAGPRRGRRGRRRPFASPSSSRARCANDSSNAASVTSSRSVSSRLRLPGPEAVHDGVGGVPLRRGERFEPGEQRRVVAELAAQQPCQALLLPVEVDERRVERVVGRGVDALRLAVHRPGPGRASSRSSAARRRWCPCGTLAPRGRPRWPQVGSARSSPVGMPTARASCHIALSLGVSSSPRSARWIVSRLTPDRSESASCVRWARTRASRRRSPTALR